MRILKFTNSKGKNIVLSNAAPIILTKIEGISGLDVDVQMQKSPYQDGETYLDSVLPMRIISIEGAITATTETEINQYRRLMLEIFSPKLGIGILRYESGSTIREIPAVVDNGVIFPDKQTTPFQKFIISLCSPMPFWLEENVQVTEMADWVGGLMFPLSLPSSFSGRSSRTNTVINNGGDVETPVNITFSGGAINPIVRLIDTGEYIKIKKNVASNEKLLISTEFGNKKVVLLNIETGVITNAFGYIDLGSTFFQLAVGDNQMNFGTDAGTANITVKVEWRNRYVGV